MNRKILAILLLVAVGCASKPAQSAMPKIPVMPGATEDKSEPDTPTDKVWDWPSGATFDEVKTWYQGHLPVGKNLGSWKWGKELSDPPLSYATCWTQGGNFLTVIVSNQESAGSSFIEAMVQKGDSC